jgi:Tol biopolymer transport system component
MCLVVVLGVAFSIPPAAVARDTMLVSTTYIDEEDGYVDKLWRAKPDGTDRELLFSGRVPDFAMSPTGHQVAFTQTGPQGAQLRIMGIDGLESTVLAANVPPNYLFLDRVEFHPSGRSVIYNCVWPGEVGICSRRLDGAHTVDRVAPWSGGGQQLPTLSPDGTQVAFVTYEGPGGEEYDEAQLFVTDIDGSDPVRLTPPDGPPAGAW